MSREFQFGCTFDLLSLAPRHEGVVLAALVPKARRVSKQACLERADAAAALSLPARDARLIEGKLDQLTSKPPATIAGYL